jgi:tetratricopeptide (TPR) repeat protein
VRVTAQLIDARSGYHLWSDTYDRQLDDIFAIQDEIATEVVRALRLTLLDTDAAVISQTAKGDVEAYNHYLRGQAHVRLRTRSGLERALEEFQQAILIDPGYAPSYAGIAMVYALFDNYGYRDLAETGELAHRALDRALALDPHSDEAWAVRGLLLGQGPGAQHRRAEARAALERAVEINPNNAFAHLWLAGTLMPDFEAARRALHRAYDLDPLSPVIVYRRAMDAMPLADESEFDRFQAELQEVAPDWFITWQAAGNAAQQSGRLAEAALAYERAVELNPEYVGSIAPLSVILEMLGYEAQAQAILESAQRLHGSDEYRALLAAMRARRALQEDGHAAALAVYRPVIEALESPSSERLAEVALLEIGAGRPDAAEQRLRHSLRIEPGAEPGPLEDPEQLLQYLALGMALAERGEHAASARYFARLREMFGQLKAEGISFNYMPVVEGMMAHFEGQSGVLLPAMSESIRLGFRAPPATLRWFLLLEPDNAELQRMTREMKELLAEERRRYDAARAGT